MSQTESIRGLKSTHLAGGGYSISEAENFQNERNQEYEDCLFGFDRTGI